MKKIIRLLSIATIAFICFSYIIPKKKKAVLVFSKTAGYRHASIKEGKIALLKLGLENNFTVDTTEDSTKFTSAILKKYDAVIFLNTTGNVLSDDQQKSFEEFIKSGKGFLGIHSATDTEYDWAWFGKLVGAYFLNHPRPQLAKLIITDKKNIATMHLPDVWERTDEWYNFKNINPGINVLMTIDETSYQGGKNGASHPMAWYHEFDGGKSFYTELGHTPESYSDPLFLQHLLGGIKYVTGMK